MLKVFRHINEIFTLQGASKKEARNTTLSDLSVISDAALICYEGKIKWIGKDQDLKNSPLEKLTLEHKEKYNQDIEEQNLKGSFVCPGFVESHTHLVFAGSRQDEFDKRSQGVKYSEIAEQGGGILSTVKATRDVSFEELLSISQKRVDLFIQQGVTALEIKSGYGLNLEAEKKMLEVILELYLLKKNPHIVRTFLALHALPPEFKSTSKYTNHVIEKILPEVRHLIDRADIFIEKGYFELKDAERFFKVLQKEGIALTVHTEQMNLNQGYALGLNYKAQSLDHLVCADNKAISKIAKSETTAVLLPASDLYLKCDYPPARKLIDKGARVAVATDFNPGSSPTQDLSLVGVLSRVEMKMTLPEVLVAYTLGGAFSLGLQKTTGSLEEDKSADFLVLDESPLNLFSEVGHHPIKKTFCRGEEISAQETRSPEDLYIYHDFHQHKGLKYE